jgi:hypothetical protein
MPYLSKDWKREMYKMWNASQIVISDAAIHKKLSG